MKKERFIVKLIKGIRTFAILSIGAMIAMFLEYGIESYFVLCTVLALFLYISTTIAIKKREMEQNENEE